MSVAQKEFKKVTTNSVQEMKARGEKISMLTAYDYTLAKMVDKAGIDVMNILEVVTIYVHCYERQFRVYMVIGCL